MARSDQSGTAWSCLPTENIMLAVGWLPQQNSRAADTGSKHRTLAVERGGHVAGRAVAGNLIVRKLIKYLWGDLSICNRSLPASNQEKQHSQDERESRGFGDRRCWIIGTAN